jgi:hypothetical protein
MQHIALIGVLVAGTLALSGCGGSSRATTVTVTSAPGTSTAAKRKPTVGHEFQVAVG